MAPRPVSVFIDYSGDVPSLKVKKLVATLIGVPAFAWITGIIGLINDISDGIGWTLGAIKWWLFLDVVGGIFGGAERTVLEAWVANANWLEQTFGLLAFPIAILEVALLTLLLSWIVRQTIGALVGGG